MKKLVLSIAMLTASAIPTLAEDEQMFMRYYSAKEIQTFCNEDNDFSAGVCMGYIAAATDMARWAMTLPR